MWGRELNIEDDTVPIVLSLRYTHSFLDREEIYQNNNEQSGTGFGKGGT